MAKKSCKVGKPKETSRTSTFAGKGRNKGRTCVKVDLVHGRSIKRTKGGGVLADSGKRFFGCYGSAAKAKAAAARVDKRKAVC